MNIWKIGAMSVALAVSSGVYAEEQEIFVPDEAVNEESLAIEEDILDEESLLFEEQNAQPLSEADLLDAWLDTLAVENGDAELSTDPRVVRGRCWRNGGWRVCWRRAPRRPVRGVITCFARNARGITYRARANAGIAASSTVQARAMRLCRQNSANPRSCRPLGCRHTAR